MMRPMTKIGFKGDTYRWVSLVFVYIYTIRVGFGEF